MRSAALLCFVVAACSPADSDDDGATGSSPAAPLIEPNDCVATDAASLRDCVQSVIAHTTSRIAITEDITCSGPVACRMSFDGFTGPATIFGAKSSGQNAVLHRIDHLDYNLIEIYDSSGLEFRDLDLQEGERNQPAGLFGTPEYDVNASCDATACASAVVVSSGSHDILFDDLSILESKGQGMEIGNVENLTLRNSFIRHAWANGIWTTSGDLPVPDEHVPYNLKIENNLFVDNRCSAIELSAARESVISGNVLRHNHMGAIYHVPGGQLAIEKNTTDLTIVDNEIHDGRIDEDEVLATSNFLSVGIEFTDSHVHGVVIEHNYIHDATGGGIIHDPTLPGSTRTDFGPIRIADNTFERVGGPDAELNNFDPPDLVTSNNCSGSACAWERPTGTLTSSPETCALDPETGVCSLTLSWSTAGVWSETGVKVLINGSTFASASSGSQDAPWIDAGLSRFDLYDGKTLLDSVRLQGL